MRRSGLRGGVGLRGLLRRIEGLSEWRWKSGKRSKTWAAPARGWSRALVQPVRQLASEGDLARRPVRDVRAPSHREHREKSETARWRTSSVSGSDRTSAADSRRISRSPSPTRVRRRPRGRLSPRPRTARTGRSVRPMAETAPSPFASPELGGPPPVTRPRVTTRWYGSRIAPPPHEDRMTIDRIAPTLRPDGPAVRAPAVVGSALPPLGGGRRRAAAPAPARAHRGHVRGPRVRGPGAVPDGGNPPARAPAAAVLQRVRRGEPAHLRAPRGARSRRVLLQPRGLAPGRGGRRALALGAAVLLVRGPPPCGRAGEDVRDHARTRSSRTIAAPSSPSAGPSPSGSAPPRRARSSTSSSSATGCTRRPAPARSATRACTTTPTRPTAPRSSSPGTRLLEAAGIEGQPHPARASRARAWTSRSSRCGRSPSRRDRTRSTPAARRAGTRGAGTRAGP